MPYADYDEAIRLGPHDARYHNRGYAKAQLGTI